MHDCSLTRSPVPLMVFAVSDYNGSSPLRIHHRHTVNGHSATDGGDSVDDADTVDIRDHDDAPRRSERPVLRPLPSMSLTVTLLLYSSESLGAYSCCRQVQVLLTL